MFSRQGLFSWGKFNLRPPKCKQEFGVNSLFAFLSREAGDDQPVVGADAPVWGRGDESFVRAPASFHCRAQQNVINARVGVAFPVKVSPCNVARLEIWRFGGRVVAVALGGPRIGELELSAPDDFAR